MGLALYCGLLRDLCGKALALGLARTLPINNFFFSYKLYFHLNFSLVISYTFHPYFLTFLKFLI